MATGIINRFRTMPLRSGAVLTGHVVASLARNVRATSVVIAIALLVGFRPVATPFEWVAAFGVVGRRLVPHLHRGGDRVQGWLVGWLFQRKARRR